MRRAASSALLIGALCSVGCDEGSHTAAPAAQPSLSLSAASRSSSESQQAAEPRQLPKLRQPPEPRNKPELPQPSERRLKPKTTAEGMVDNWAYLQILKHTRFAPDGRFDLLLHFHIGGADDRATKAKLDAVLVSATLGKGSGAYRELFTGGYTLEQALARIEKAVRRQSGVANAQLDRVAVSSFSAGYGAIATLLTQPASVARIDALLMADGLHTDFIDPKNRTLSKAAMAPYMRFAKAAAERKKLMLISHSQIPTGTFASTRETADELIKGLNLPTSSRCIDDRKMALLRCFGQGDLLIAGYSGTSKALHMRHVHRQHRTMYRHLRRRWAAPSKQITAKQAPANAPPH